MRRNPGVEEAPLQNELMLFDPTTSKFYVLNGTMAFLWRHWDETKTSDELTSLLAGHYDGADHAAVSADVASAVSELKDLGLLVD
jgi:hypothetical protein